MLDVLRFIFSEPVHFFGSAALLVIIVWGISNFTLVRININHYHLTPDDLSEIEVDDEKL